MAVLWDGRADSLWAQATGPTENPVEHGSTRTEIARRMQTRYAAWYERVFGAFPPGPVAALSGARRRWAMRRNRRRGRR